MRKLILFATAALAACSGQNADTNQSVDDAEAGPAVTATTAPTRASPEMLTGLYEGGSSGARRNQLCLVEEGGGARFGLVVWGSGQTSCSGTGTAARDGERLRLSMAGDESCRLEAQLQGTTIILPTDAPAGCAYYCGSGAKLDGARFDRSGTGATAAARAVDLVGESLCSAP